MVEGVNSSMVYYMNFCKCHNVPPPTKTIIIKKIPLEGTRNRKEKKIHPFLHPTWNT
jgi:hypothetical protein